MIKTETQILQGFNILYIHYNFIYYEIYLVICMNYKDIYDSRSTNNAIKPEDESCKNRLPESQSNYNWNFHTEWDSFSEPSQTSCNEVELNDIIDDQFEEFESKTAEPLPVLKKKSKPVELFSTVDSNTDLESIFNL